MPNITMTNLRPLIANENCFRHRDVSGAVMRIWITRDKKEASIIATDVIRAAISDGTVERIGGTPRIGVSVTYRYCGIQSGNDELVLKLQMERDMLLATIESLVGENACCKTCQTVEKMKAGR